MSRLSNVPREAKLLAAALLLLKGYKQTDIAKALGVTEPTITHWIQGGRDRYWRVGAKRVGPALEAASPALKRQAQSLMHRPAVSTPELMRLAGAPRRHVLSIDVAPTHWDECRNRAKRKLGTADAANNAWRAWLAEFAGFAAPRVRDLMATGKTWGVTSGCQVDAVIDAIAALHVRPRRGVISIPLCGNPVDAHALADSSTHLAVRLERALTRRVLKPLSLALVPALIPGHLDRTSVATIWDYIAASSPAYCRIFGTDHLPPGLGFAAPRAPALVKTLNGVLTGVSRAGQPSESSHRSRATNGSNGQDATQPYVGEIGGVGLPRQGENVDPNLEQRWTGISRDDLFACAARAAERKPSAVGVVLVASGSDHADCVVEAVRLGYVSHLILDESLNCELVRRVGASSWANPKSAGDRE